MARIPQKPLFCWDQIDALGDLERLRLVLDALPDEALMQGNRIYRGTGILPVRGTAILAVPGPFPAPPRARWP